MTIKEKLAAIYKEMANKEKTMGCKYLVYAKNKPDEIIEAIEEGVSFTLFFGENDYAMSPSEVDYYEYYNIKEIIGHPVMIGDALDYLEEKKLYCFDLERTGDCGNMYDCDCGEEDYCDVCSSKNLSSTIGDLLHHWLNKRTPIEDQSDECIDYVYSLIQKD